MLPGVGIRYELTTGRGVPLGIVVHREGDVYLSTFHPRDPDLPAATLHLSAEEAAALADLLGAPRITQRFVDLSREVPGLLSARLTIDAGSRFANRPLGDTQARSRTGCSIIAVVRGEEVIVSPEPDELLRIGDMLVAIGGETGLAQLQALIIAPTP